MLSVFPDLYTYQLVVPLMLRVILGLLFIYFGYMKLYNHREQKLVFFSRLNLNPPILFLSATALLEIVGGVFLLVGFFLQPSAIALALLMLGTVLVKIFKPSSLPNDIGYYLLLLITTISLVFLGPGFFAFDFPL